MGRVEEKEGRREGSEAGFTGFIGFVGSRVELAPTEEVGGEPDGACLLLFVSISEILR